MKKTLLLLVLAGLSLAAQAAEKKRVIVCTVTVGWRHSSIPTAEAALQKIANESGAFEIVEFVRQPLVNGQPAPSGQHASVDEAVLKKTLEPLSPTNLKAKKIDGVIFANTTGDLPLPDKEGFIQWIAEGHSFMGMHSASDTFPNFPGFNGMLQGHFQSHGAQVAAELHAADKNHPANAGLGDKFEISQEEMYRIKDQDPKKVRSLWFMKHEPNNPNEPGFFPVSWCRMEGKGRVFYTSLGHREDIWSDDPAIADRKNSPEVSKKFQAHILGGMKWALGLMPGDATPNPEVK